MNIFVLFLCPWVVFSFNSPVLFYIDIFDDFLVLVVDHLKQGSGEEHNFLNK